MSKTKNLPVAKSPSDLANELKIEELLPEINANHRECFKSGRDAVAHAKQAGDLLWKLKELCKHGDFQSTVEKRLDCALRTAQIYMKLSAGLPALLKKNNEAIGPDATISGYIKLIGQSKPKAHDRAQSTQSGGAKKLPSQSDEPLTPAEDETPQSKVTKAVEKALEEAEPDEDLTFDEQVKDANKAIEDFCQGIKQFCLDNRPKVQSLTDDRFNSALAAVKSACETLRTCKYDKRACPRCKGDGCKTCEKESDFGAVTATTYQQVAR